MRLPMIQQIRMVLRIAACGLAFVPLLCSCNGTGEEHHNQRSIMNQQVPSATAKDASGSTPVQTAQTATGAGSETSVVGSLFSTESPSLSLMLTEAIMKPIPPMMLVRSLAQYYGLQDLWTPPRDNVLRTNYPECTNAATKFFCAFTLSKLDELYINLGGESRDVTSTAETQMTAGDFVLIYKLAAQVCTLKSDGSSGVPSGSNETAARLGISVGQTREKIADALLKKFLGAQLRSQEGEVEKRFLLDELMVSGGQAVSTYPDTEAGRALLHRHFSAACVYLMIHPWQAIY